MSSCLDLNCAYVSLFSSCGTSIHCLLWVAGHNVVTNICSIWQKNNNNALTPQSCVKGHQQQLSALMKKQLNIYTFAFTSHSPQNTNKIKYFIVWEFVYVWSCCSMGSSWHAPLPVSLSPWPLELGKWGCHTVPGLHNHWSTSNIPPRWQLKQTWGLTVTQPFLSCLAVWLLRQRLQWALNSKYHHVVALKETYRWLDCMHWCCHCGN